VPLYIYYNEVEILIPGSNSLKDRRMVVRSIKDKITNKYDIIVNIENDNDSKKRIKIYFVSSSFNKDYLFDLNQKLSNFLIYNYDLTIVNEEKEIIRM